MNENKLKESIEATELIKSISMIHQYIGSYLIIRDSGTCVNLVKALNMLAEYGWEAINITTYGNFSFALIHKRSE